MIQLLPAEVFKSILHRLDPNAQLQCSLVSQHLMGLVAMARRLLIGQKKASLSLIGSMTLQLEEAGCTLTGQLTGCGAGDVPAEGLKKSEHSGHDFHLCLVLCQCPNHLLGHVTMLKHLLALIGPHLREVTVDDCLIGGFWKRGRSQPINGTGLNDGEGRMMSPLLLHHVLAGCPNIARLNLHNVDLAAINRGTLFRLTELAHLAELNIDSATCAASPRTLLDDAFYARLALAGNLRQFLVTQSGSLTDVTMYFLAVKCPRLWYADVTGCKGVTAKGVAYFVLNQIRRTSEMLYLKLGSTNFDLLTLQRDLHSKMTPSEFDCWKFGAVNVEVTGRQGVSVVHSGYPGKCLILFN